MGCIPSPAGCLPWQGTACGLRLCHAVQCQAAVEATAGTRERMQPGGFVVPLGQQGVLGGAGGVRLGGVSCPGLVLAWLWPCLCSLCASHCCRDTGMFLQGVGVAGSSSGQPWCYGCGFLLSGLPKVFAGGAGSRRRMGLREQSVPAVLKSRCFWPFGVRD